MKLSKKNVAFIVMVIVIVAVLGTYFLYPLLNPQKAEVVVNVAVADKSCYEPWWIADKLGYFKDEGVTVKYMVVSGGGAAATALLSGQVDLAGMGADPMIRVFNARDGDKIVARWQIGFSACDYAVRTDSGINLTDATTLLGKKMGMDTTTAYYSVYLSYLTDCVKDGLLTEDQKDTLVGAIIHTDFADLVPALIQGSLDVISGGSYNSIAVAQGNGAIEMQMDPYKHRFSVCLLASEIAMSEKSHELTKVLKVLQRACDYINDPATLNDACQIVVDVYGGMLTVELQRNYYALSTWGLGFNQTDIDYIQFVYIISYPETALNVTTLFEPKYLKEIKGNNFTWPTG